MIYDLAQPLYTNCPQFPGQPPNSVRYHQHAVVDGATVERVELMTHSGSHVDAPFHYHPLLPSISELPLQHFFGCCVALDLRGLTPKHGINRADLEPHEERILDGVFLLLKTGWGEERRNTKRFLTEWPYMSGDGAQYLLERNVKGMGIDALSTGGYPEKHAESDAHLLLLGAQKLLLEDIHIPEPLLDGKVRFFSAFPILIANASGSFVRPVVWDEGDLEKSRSESASAARVPEQVQSMIDLERSESR